MLKIIAVVGQAGSGKDTAAKYIAKKYGYENISTADILRDYITKNSLGSLDRENMGNQIKVLRKSKGNDILARMALEGKSEGRYLLSALRHPDESRLVQNLGGTIIVTKSSLKSRYERNKARNRAGDDISFEEFKKLEERENSGDGFDIKEVESMADYTVNNDSSYEDFYRQVDDVMSKIDKH
jgi:dephospho-CoA kinase